MAIDARIRELFRALKSAVEEEVNHRNQSIQHAREKLEFTNDPLGTFLIRRPAFPALRLEVSTGEGANPPLIQYSYVSKRTKDSQDQLNKGRFTLMLIGDTLAIVNAEHRIKVDEACRLPLEPFLNPLASAAS